MPSRRFAGGHTDFVKSIVTTKIQAKDLLISGGADALIVVWDIISGAKLQVLRSGHSRGILDLALDPESPAFAIPAAQHEPETSIHLFTASSDRTIRRFALTFPGPGPTAEVILSEIDPSTPLIPHETSIYALRFSFSDDSDLWTASADGFAKCLSRARHWVADTELVHGDHVRAIVVDDVGGLIVTGGRDEEVKVWDQGSGELVCGYEGHFDEITGMVLVGERREVVSVGIDASVRRWGLRRGELERVRREREERGRGGDGEEEDENEAGKQEMEGKAAGLLTEEEEKELEALMQDSE